MVDDKSTTERIRLLEGDLTSTTEFIKGVVAVSAGLRASAITLWVALLGFALSQNEFEVAWLALVIVVIFAFVDAYHGWLYAAALRHARSIEKLLAEYYNAISRYRDEPTVQAKFRGSLRAHRYGMYRALPGKFHIRDLFKARPRPIYIFVYPILAFVAVCISVAMMLGTLDEQDGDREQGQDTCQCQDRLPASPQTTEPQ